ncbi:hypothetical protein [Staphylococcus aureus]
MIEIKNSDLVKTRSFLYGLKLKPKLSRHRTKFIRLLDNKIEDLTNASNELIQQFAKKDNQGNPIVKDNLVEFDDINKRIQFEKEDRILFNEISKIDLSEYPLVKDALKQSLNELDIVLEKEEAETYELLSNLFDVD